jgi:hypothetical protein
VAALVSRLVALKKKYEDVIAEREVFDRDRAQSMQSDFDFPTAIDQVTPEWLAAVLRTEVTSFEYDRLEMGALSDAATVYIHYATDNFTGDDEDDDEVLMPGMLREQAAVEAAAADQAASRSRGASLGTQPIVTKPRSIVLKFAKGEEGARLMGVDSGAYLKEVRCNEPPLPLPLINPCPNKPELEP